MKTIDASTAAILNATSPIFSAIVAAVWIRERLTVEKVAGIALSIVGIAVLVGWTPRPMTGARAPRLLALARGLRVLRLLERVHQGAPEGRAARGALHRELPRGRGGDGALHAVARARPPVPGLAWAAVAVLGVVCTGFAFILYYRLIADLGPVRATTVTLLMPVFGILWGVLFLGEPLTPGRIAGCGNRSPGLCARAGLAARSFRRSAG